MCVSSCRPAGDTAAWASTTLSPPSLASEDLLLYASCLQQSHKNCIKGKRVAWHIMHTCSNRSMC